MELDEKKLSNKEKYERLLNEIKSKNILTKLENKIEKFIYY